MVITAFEPDREIAWTIEGTIRPPLQHVYGYRMEPADGGTLVTSYCDWSNLREDYRPFLTFPIVPESALKGTLGHPRPHGAPAGTRRVRAGRRLISADVSAPARSRTLRDAVGLGLAVGFYGIAFGAASDAAGLDVWQTMTLSALMFSGASQFALVGVIGAGGSAPAAIGSALLLGTRNTVYGVRMAPLLAPRTLLGRAGAAHWVIDETTAMAVAAPDRELGRLAFWATGATIYLGWNAMTLVGALGASGARRHGRGGAGRRRPGRVPRPAVAAADGGGLGRTGGAAAGGARGSGGRAGADAVRAGGRAGHRRGRRRGAGRPAAGPRSGRHERRHAVDGGRRRLHRDCYLLKLAGISVPAAWVEQPWVARIVDFVPAALLAALVAVQGLTTEDRIVVDGRLAGLAVAALALALRAPFIVVIALAGATGAGVHLLTG